MGISYGNYEPTERKKREEKVNEIGSDFVVYPRIWLNYMAKCNYGFDWNRDFDDVLRIESRKKNELLDNCIKGKDKFQSLYESGKSVINKKDYSAPYLIMFENHGEVTGREVLLNLYVHFEDANKLKNSFIKIECNNSSFDVGFTTNGKTIATNVFNLEKKYFKDKYYEIARRFREENGKEKSYKDTLYEPQLNPDNVLELSNVIIKCKKAIDKEETIKFIDNKGNIVGSLIVKPNNKAIFSKRKMCFVKVKRKNYLEQDLRTIKTKILTTQVLDYNGEERKYSNEYDAISDVVREANACGFSKLLVNYSNSFEIDELEIDDEKLKEKGIISDEMVLDETDYLTTLENQYFLNKKYDEDAIKSRIFVFLNPIKDKESDVLGYATYEDVNVFSSICFMVGSYTITHEVGHDFGLIHSFDLNDKSDLDIKEKYIRTLEKNQILKKDNIEIFNKDLKIRPKSQYPTHYTLGENRIKVNNSVEWKNVITELELDYKKTELLIEKQKKLVSFIKRANQYHEIAFAKKTTDNLMDYSMPYLSFYYQHETLTKLNDEFKHI